MGGVFFSWFIFFRFDGTYLLTFALGSIVTLPEGFVTVMIPDVCIHRGKLIFDSLYELLSAVCRRMESDSSDVDGKTAVLFSLIPFVRHAYSGVGEHIRDQRIPIL
jgi:hypothetical protein